MWGMRLLLKRQVMMQLMPLMSHLFSSAELTEIREKVKPTANKKYRAVEVGTPQDIPHVITLEELEGVKTPEELAELLFTVQDAVNEVFPWLNFNDLPTSTTGAVTYQMELNGGSATPQEVTALIKSIIELETHAAETPNDN